MTVVLCMKTTLGVCIRTTPGRCFFLVVIMASGTASPSDEDTPDDNILGADLRDNETEDTYCPWDKKQRVVGSGDGAG